MKLFIALLFIFYCAPESNGQNSRIDSMIKIVNAAPDDSNKVKTLLEVVSEYYLSDIDKSEKYCLEAKTISEKINYKKGIADSYAWLGYLCEQRGKTNEAIEYYKQSLVISEKQKDYLSIGAVINNIGYVYSKIGDYLNGIKYYKKSLANSYKIKDSIGYNQTLINIGYVYAQLGDINKAIEYYNKALLKFENDGDIDNAGVVYNNIALLYSEQNEKVKALDFFIKALKSFEIIGNKVAAAKALNNIGSIYLDFKNYHEAKKYLFKSLSFNDQLVDSSQTITTILNLGDCYYAMGEKQTAIKFYYQALNISERSNYKYLEAMALNKIAEVQMQSDSLIFAEATAKKSLQLARDIGDPQAIKIVASTLKKIYLMQKKYKEAYDAYSVEVSMKDSVLNNETQKIILKRQYQYDYSKRAMVDSINYANENKVKNAIITANEAQLEKEKTQRFALYGGLFVVLIFAGFIFNRFQVTKRQKNIIEKSKQEIEIQKQIVEIHRQDILDSISYAKRLQEAILPPKQFIDENIKNNFIVYRPKDIVAGDFYWAEKIGDNFYIAVADCTGHGVPGAMISVVCSSALKRCVKEFNITETGKILDKTREIVIETFAKSSESVKDGMDISLLSIDMKNRKILWSGAYNPLWYIFNGKLYEIKADKQTVGMSEVFSPFSTFEVNYNPATTFYLFTDGFADQFGGEKGKKFKYKQLQELLLSINDLDMKEQYQKLNIAFDNWKGNLEQVDDVCIVGLQI